MFPGRTQIAEIPTIFIVVPVLDNGDSRGWVVVFCRFKNCHSMFIQLLLTEHQGYVVEVHGYLWWVRNNGRQHWFSYKDTLVSLWLNISVLVIMDHYREIIVAEFAILLWIVLICKRDHRLNDSLLTVSNRRIIAFSKLLKLMIN